MWSGGLQPAEDLGSTKQCLARESGDCFYRVRDWCGGADACFDQIAGRISAVVECLIRSCVP